MYALAVFDGLNVKIKTLRIIFQTNGFNSITFGKLGDSVLLIWANSKWNIIGRQGATETPDTVTAAGAVSLTSPVTFVSSSGAAYDITLGHGIEGQMKNYS